MKNIYLAASFTLLMCLTTQNVSADDCRACGGSGKVLISGMGTYGLTTEKKTCSRCGQTFIKGSDHWCICTACGGTRDDGRIRTKSSREERREDAEANAILDGMDLMSSSKHTYINIPNPATPVHFDSTTTSHKKDNSPILTIIIITLLLIIGKIIYKRWKTNKGVVKSPKAEIMHHTKNSKDNNATQNSTSIEDVNKNNNLNETIQKESHDVKNEETSSSHKNANNNNKFFKFVKAQSSELKEAIDNYDSDKIKEDIQSSLTTIKDTSEKVNFKVKKFMLDHDVIGKLKFSGQLILVLIFTLCKYIIKAILFIMKLLVQAITRLSQLISSFTKK